MKYSNLLHFLLVWTDFKDDLINKRAYEKAMGDNCASVRYRVELQEARREYLEYLKGSENEI